MMGDAADTSNRSGSGSAVSYSESCAPYGSDNVFKGALFRTDLQHNEQTPLLQKNRHSLCCSPPMTRTMDLLPPPPWRFGAAGVRLGEDDDPKPKIHLDLDDGLREFGGHGERSCCRFNITTIKSAPLLASTSAMEKLLLVQGLVPTPWKDGLWIVDLE